MNYVHARICYYDCVEFPSYSHNYERILFLKKSVKYILNIMKKESNMM